MSGYVTDPALLAQLEGKPAGGGYVTDPALLAQLEGKAPAAKPKEGWDAVGDRLSRFGSGLMDPVVGAGQIADRFLVDPIRQAISPGATSMRDVIRERDASYQAPEGFDWMRTAGNVANPMTWGGGGAASVPRMVATGAMQAALAPTEADDSNGMFLLKKAGQAALGGTVAGAAGKLTKGLAKPTADAQALIDQGVHVPPGAAMGGGAAKLEERLSSMPIAGETVDAGRRKALEDVQTKVMERATGIPGLADVRAGNTAASNLYKQSVPHMRNNPEAVMDAAAAYNAALHNPELTPAHKEILTGLWDKNFNIDNFNDLTGEGLKKLDSELGYLGRKYSAHGGSPADKTLSDEIYNIMGAFRGGLEKGMPANEASVLKQANRAFRGMVPVNKAASSRGDELATPRALQKALARQARTDVTRMPPDKLLDPAVETLSSKVADSGTAGRAATMNPLSWAAGAAAWLPMAAAQSRRGAKALVGQTDWQKALDPYSNRLSQAMIAALRQ